MSSTYTQPILLTGDMFAALSGSPTQQANPGDADFGAIMPGVEAIDDSSSIYRLVWYQNLSETATEIRNGQFWRLESYDPTLDPDGDPSTGDDGWSVVSGMNEMVPRDDMATGAAAGDEYIVFQGPSGFFLYDLNGDLPTTPTTLTYLASAEDGATDIGDNDGQLDFTDAYNAAVCFASGTPIATPDGPRPVELLRPGDLVLTLDHGPAQVRWTACRNLSGVELARNSKLRPVRIRAGALGGGRPNRDLLVSPQHRLLVTSRIAERMFDSASVLVPAIRLTDLPGISQVSAPNGVQYHHILTDRHEVIFAAGALAETLFPGREALRMIGPESRAELFALFPDLAARVPGCSVRPAYPLVAGSRARGLVARHKKNGKCLSAM